MTSQTNIEQAVTISEDCVLSIRGWFGFNFLSLNDEKTIVMFFCSAFKPMPPLPSIKVGEATIEPLSTAKNLGVTFDIHMTHAAHVKNVTAQSFHQLRQLKAVTKYLDKPSTCTLIHGFVSSRIDYCSSLLFGIPNNLLQRLQYVQNAAAHFIMQKHKYDHISEALNELHWLPVSLRIQYRILLLVFKALKGMAPKYIIDLLDIYTPARTLRSSSDHNRLVEKRFNTKHYGYWAFSIHAPRLWNALPADLRMSVNVNDFQKQLKTHLFKQVFK